MNVVLYARVSSDRQDVDLSITAQLKNLREYASTHGYRSVGEYVDEAESGRTAHRPQFQKMIADARKGSKPFEMVLVWKYSRFARSREDSIVYKTLLRKHNVQVISITEPFDDTPTGKLLEAMIESLDEFYSANLAQDIMRGMRESASRGYLVSPGTPYGYRRVKVKDGRAERASLEADPHAAAIVTRMFQRVLNRRGLKEIAQELNKDGIAPPRAKRWGVTTIHKVLTNEAYVGTLVWGAVTKKTNGAPPIRVEDAWPAIVERETFDRAQELLRERAPKMSHPRRVASNYLLSGIAKCATCGKALIGQEAKSGKFAYYVCGTLIRQGKGACDAPYLNAAKFERHVIDELKAQVLTQEHLRALVRLLAEEMDSTSTERRERLEAVKEDLDDVATRLERLYDALETGKLTLDDLGPRIQQLRVRQDQLMAAREDLEQMVVERRQELADLALVTHYADDLQELLSKGNLAEQRSFIKTFVEEVRVSREGAVLVYTVPLPPDYLMEQKTGVLAFIYTRWWATVDSTRTLCGLTWCRGCGNSLAI
ncbi:MAG: recombinase family protein [Chloroflexi bacterium]|nr:recombinase family protein [Chloroflexota bacterium]